MNTHLITVSLRELYELPYRAFRVIGASHGEASSSAEAARYAQLEQGCGISHVVGRCARDWGRGDVRVTKTVDASSLHYCVQSEEAFDMFSLGMGPVDLLGSVQGEVVVTAFAERLTPIIDYALIRAAKRKESPMQVQHWDGEREAFRFAMPNGDLGVASVRSDGPEGQHRQPNATILSSGREIPPELLNSAEMISASQRVRTRMQAAEHGVSVPVQEWEALAAIADGYKQPDA